MAFACRLGLYGTGRLAAGAGALGHFREYKRYCGVAQSGAQPVISVE